MQQLLTSREEDRLAAVNRMHASRKKANMLRAADLQVGITKYTSRLYPCAMLGGDYIVSQSCLPVREQCARYLTVARFVLYSDAHCLLSSSFTALLLQGQEVLKREAATLLQRSLAAEKLAADRLAALTAKEREAAHLHRSLRDANTALADALEVKSLPVP